MFNAVIRQYIANRLVQVVDHIYEISKQLIYFHAKQYSFGPWHSFYIIQESAPYNILTFDSLAFTDFIDLDQ